MKRLWSRMRSVSFMPSERKLGIMYSACLIALLFVSVVPLIVLSQYNHPSADDFAYAKTTFLEWNHSHSLFRLLGEAVATSKRFFNEWQGLYSSAFFLALHPAVFGEAYYSWTGVIMLCIIGGVTRFFLSVSPRDWLAVLPWMELQSEAWPHF